jgi:hypothetical protein
MLHFDLNPSNLLTDGEQVYAADFGLALCEDFDLSPEERVFFQKHRLYDRCYVDGAFVDWLVPEAMLRHALPSALSALVDRCTPVAHIFGTFLNTLREGSKTTPYPGSELESALAEQAEAR